MQSRGALRLSGKTEYERRAPITAPSANPKNRSMRAAVLPAYCRSTRSGAGQIAGRFADRLHLLLEKRVVVSNIGNGVDNQGR
jgi:hypothetical protein